MSGFEEMNQEFISSNLIISMEVTEGGHAE